jgi:hypothetical protein
MSQRAYSRSASKQDAASPERRLISELASLAPEKL